MGTTETSNHSQWRNEIGFLGTILGETIRLHAGQPAFELVERIRRLSWMRRSGDTQAEAELKQLIAELDETEIRVVIRSFTIFLDLLNLVEDRTRTQVLRQRSEAALPSTRAESIGRALESLQSSGKSASDIETLLEQLNVELVFTAHPTEAKRRSVRRKLREIRSLLAQYHDESLAYRRSQIEDAIYRELALLWQTNFIRPWRPSVLQEVERGLSIQTVLWDVVPRIADDIRRGFQSVFDQLPASSPPPVVTFGSWIGGDRDGHPGVTSDVTAETLSWLRQAAIENHIASCDALFDTFTVSNRQADLGPSLQPAITETMERAPELQEKLAPIPPGELARRWLAIIGWKLRMTLTDDSAGYPNANALEADLQLLIDAIQETASGSRTVGPMLDWQTQIRTFGFHLAKLDVRQNASVFRVVIDELLQMLGCSDNPSDLSEAERCEILGSDPPVLSGEQRPQLSEASREVMDLFELLHGRVDSDGLGAVGAMIVSMTSTVSDILSVQWLWNLTRSPESDTAGTPAIVPLLETVDDLANGPAILEQLLSSPAYRANLSQLGDRQMVMLGYSDSTKDGGYLSACWALHQCQRSLADTVRKHGVSVTFFHGRGGSLGRGGGPAARSILSLPGETFDGHIRITEQGEVLAERYDDPEIAHRHLEQMVWSSLLAANSNSTEVKPEWVHLLDKLSSRSRLAYRNLVDQPGFVRFFRRVTPISEIEQLPIGSRPSRRKPDGGLSDLRAIPWVFSWTQCRCLLPAWFGMGTAFAELDNASTGQLQDLYRHWPFFRAAINNAELALAKADRGIMQEYFSLAADDSELSPIAQLILDEHDRAMNALLRITGEHELLAGIGWLKESIRVRNRFIDPLNLLQVEMMRRWSGDQATDAEDKRHLMRLAINGVASGMRTSG